MADSKLADLTNDATPLLTDYFYKVIAAGTSGSDRKATLGSMRRVIGAQVYRATAQSIPASTDVAVSFSNARFDTNSLWSAGAPTRLTVPTGMGGKWLVVLQVAFGTSGSGNRQQGPLINGATSGQGFYLGINSGASNNIYISTAGILRLSAADYVEHFVWQSSGGALNIGNNGDLGASMSLIFMGE